MTYDEFASTRLAALLRYAVMLTGDPHLAQDLVQDTMVRIQLKWRQVAKADSPERYARRMLTNAYLDARRGSWLRRVVLRGEQPETATPDDPHAAVLERDEVWAWLAQLPRQQRAALVLRFYEDLNDADAAAILGCSVATVRAHVSRALTHLRTEIVPARAGGRAPIRPMEA